MRLNIKDLPAWIINLDRSHDRWMRSFRALSSVLIPERLHRISAMDGREFASGETQGEAAWKQDVLSRLQREGHLGQSLMLDPVRTALCLSHQRALHAFLESGEPWGLIFEDDVRPGEALPLILANGGWLSPPDDAEVLFLHDRIHARGQPESSALTDTNNHEQWKVVRGGIGLEAYVVSRLGARKILAAWRPVVMECDLQLLTFMSGYADISEKKRVQQNFVANGGNAIPSIQAYSTHRPLFQTDHWTPSVKFATIREGAGNQKPWLRTASDSHLGSVTLNRSTPLGMATVWFNPAQYQSRRDNFQRFHEGIKSLADRLLVVELAFEDEPWQLPELPNIVRLRSNTVCWQKEALLNYAFDHLAHAGFKYLAWLDADVVFSSEDWYERATDVLSKRRLCQLFTEGETHFPDLGRRVESGVAHGWTAKGKAPLTLGCTGLGWGMQREVWEAARLFDMDIVGGGDYTMWHGVFANYLSPNKVFWNLACTPEFRRVRGEWAKRWSTAVGMDVGYVPGIRVKSLPHGEIRKRRYQKRGNILRTHQFSPLKHMSRDESGLLQWTDEASLEFRQEVRRYFYERAEDI